MEMATAKGKGLNTTCELEFRMRGLLAHVK